MTKVDIKKKPKKDKETQSGLQTISKGIKKVLQSTPQGAAIKIAIDAGRRMAESLTKDDKKDRKTVIDPDTGKAMLEGGGLRKFKTPRAGRKDNTFAGGGLAEATARLKAKGMKEGGMVVKDKTVAIDKSPNSGLITTKGFGAGRRT